MHSFSVLKAIVLCSVLVLHTLQHQTLFSSGPYLSQITLPLRVFTMLGVGGVNALGAASAFLLVQRGCGSSFRSFAWRKYRRVASIVVKTQALALVFTQSFRGADGSYDMAALLSWPTLSACWIPGLFARTHLNTASSVNWSLLLDFYALSGVYALMRFAPGRRTFALAALGAGAARAALFWQDECTILGSTLIDGRALTGGVPLYSHARQDFDPALTECAQRHTFYLYFFPPARLLPYCIGAQMGVLHREGYRYGRASLAAGAAYFAFNLAAVLPPFEGERVAPEMTFVGTLLLQTLVPFFALRFMLCFDSPRRLPEWADAAMEWVHVLHNTFVHALLPSPYPVMVVSAATLTHALLLAF